MGRKSAVGQLPSDVRERVREKLADGAETLEGVRRTVGEEFPGVTIPGTTSLHRERKNIERWAQRAAEARLITQEWISKLGDSPESEIGKMLQEALRLLAFDAASQLQEPEIDEQGNALPMDIKALAALSRSYLAIENAARISAERERELIAEGERRAMERMGAAAKKAGLSREDAKRLRAELGGAQTK